ncbi:hypothetical protein CVT25_011971 [Psilocybe cyanescens]|uniref:DUF5648 domain-containing protein n=1 Tax=Psilocybe cyanescens TaxID=93625 RepID=A0A409XH32_PSICY|nr:hypothetical protein CVT25_011971 [Psilocybe cyanescens]
MIANILLTCLLSLSLSHISTFGVNAEKAIPSTSGQYLPPSSDPNCADPSLTARYITYFNTAVTAHTVDQRFYFINNDGAGAGAQWVLQGDNFCAWGTAQNFTSPLYLFYNPSTNDYHFILSADGTVPKPSGLQAQGIRAHVYATQVCGSVPLYTLSKPSVGDHWYTIFQGERETLISFGWVDGGILAYVLPLESRSCLLMGVC